MLRFANSTKSQAHQPPQFNSCWAHQPPVVSSNKDVIKNTLHFKFKNRFLNARLVVGVGVVL